MKEIADKLENIVDFHIRIETDKKLREVEKLILKLSKEEKIELFAEIFKRKIKHIPVIYFAKYEKDYDTGFIDVALQREETILGRILDILDEEDDDIVLPEDSI